MPKNLGRRMRQLRKEKGLTLVEISKKTGVAQATLSRIETGTMTGTVESHERIAEAIGVGLAELYADVDTRYDQIALLRKEDEHKVSQLDKNVQVELLTTETFKKKITPLLIQFQPGGKTPSERSERGVEKFVYVLEGELKIHIDKEEYSLKSGESLYFDASLPHQLQNDKNRASRLLVAVSPSKI